MFGIAFLSPVPFIIRREEGLDQDREEKDHPAGRGPETVRVKMSQLPEEPSDAAGASFVGISRGKFLLILVHGSHPSRRLPVREYQQRRQQRKRKDHGDERAAGHH